MDKLMHVETCKYKSLSVSFNHEPKLELPSADFKVLILFEPKAVMPWQYKRKNYSQFDLVIPMSFWRAKKLRIEHYAYQSYEYEFLEHPVSSEMRDKRVVMINSAKFSSGCTSLYGLRRATSRRLYSLGENYALYGENWNMPKRLEIKKRLVSVRNSVIARERICIHELTSQMFYRYPEYCGWVANKMEILSQSQLSLVIENDLDDVTEKLFDSMRAGAVPIYVGPEFSVEFPRLERCIIRADATVNSIIKKVQSTTDEEIQSRRFAIKEYLNDESDLGIGFWRSSRQWSKVSEIIYNALLAV
jgi:hypothetical protein